MSLQQVKTFMVRKNLSSAVITLDLAPADNGEPTCTIQVSVNNGQLQPLLLQDLSAIDLAHVLTTHSHDLSAILGRPPGGKFTITYTNKKNGLGMDLDADQFLSLSGDNRIPLLSQTTVESVTLDRSQRPNTDLVTRPEQPLVSQPQPQSGTVFSLSSRRLTAILAGLLLPLWVGGAYYSWTHLRAQAVPVKPASWSVHEPVKHVVSSPADKKNTSGRVTVTTVPASSVPASSVPASSVPAPGIPAAAKPVVNLPEVNDPQVTVTDFLAKAKTSGKLSVTNTAKNQSQPGPYEPEEQP